MKVRCIVRHWGEDAPRILARMLSQGWSVCLRCGGVPWFVDSHPCSGGGITAEEHDVVLKTSVLSFATSGIEVTP